MKIIHEEKWDVHHHINPKFYIEALESIGIDRVFGLDQPEWNEEMLLKMMKKHRFSKAILSISTPGVYFNDSDFSRKLARQCNEYMAGMIRKYPGEFGAFAAVPLPDVDGALAELDYALDGLHLDGVGVLSNVEGYYLGSPAYAPFFEALNRRKAVVYVHPTVALQKEDHSLINYMYLFLLDTTRTMLDFMRSGYHRAFPDIRFILAHGGGVLPAVYPHVLERLANENPDIQGEYRHWKSKLFLDTARIAYHDTMEAAIEAVGIDNVLLGTDYVWAKNNFAYWLKLISTMDRPATDIVKIFRGNAQRLLDSKSDGAGRSAPAVLGLAQKNRSKDPNQKIKVHFHCNPAEVVKAVAEIHPSFSADEVELWQTSAAMEWMAENDCRKVMLSLDIPQLWELQPEQVNEILSCYNRAVSAIRKENPERFGAFGAVNLSCPAYALSEIERCLGELRLDGICLYTRLYDSPLEEICDRRILKKLKNAAVPVMLHPKDSRGVPILQEGYLDAVYFVAKMLYLGQFEFLQDNRYILTHTAGVVPFLAQNLGLLYYMQYHRSNMAGFMFDWLIKKDLKGYEYLKKVTIDDLAPQDG